MAWDAALAAADPLEAGACAPRDNNSGALACSGRPPKHSCMPGFQRQGPSVGPWAASLRSAGGGAGGGGAGPRSLADEEMFARKNAIWDLMREQVGQVTVM